MFEHYASFPCLVFLLFFSVSLLLCLCSSGFSPWVYLGLCPALSQPILIMVVLFLLPFWCPVATILICSPAAQWHVTDQLPRKFIWQMKRSCTQYMTWAQTWSHICIRVGYLVGLWDCLQTMKKQACSMWAESKITHYHRDIPSCCPLRSFGLRNWCVPCNPASIHQCLVSMPAFCLSSICFSPIS